MNHRNVHAISSKKRLNHEKEFFDKKCREICTYVCLEELYDGELDERTSALNIRSLSHRSGVVAAALAKIAAELDAV